MEMDNSNFGLSGLCRSPDIRKHVVHMDNKKQPIALIVEDNPFNRKLLREFINRKGYADVEAKNG